MFRHFVTSFVLLFSRMPIGKKERQRRFDKERWRKLILDTKKYVWSSRIISFNSQTETAV